MKLKWNEMHLRPLKHMVYYEVSIKYGNAATAMTVLLYKVETTVL